SSHHSPAAPIFVSVGFRPACPSLDRDGLWRVQRAEAFRFGLANLLQDANTIERSEQVAVLQEELPHFPWQVHTIDLAGQQLGDGVSAHSLSRTMTHAAVL
ncbi:MAG: hypothetical protein DRG83_19030, partial [Deltaproteobacteria bacterium]